MHSFMAMIAATLGFGILTFLFADLWWNSRKPQPSWAKYLIVAPKYYPVAAIYFAILTVVSGVAVFTILVS